MDRYKLLNKENEFFTRISIEGIIPTWLIENDDTIDYIDNKIMYITKSCKGFLTPTDNSISIFTMEKGSTVTITGKYADWYYIRVNYNNGSNTLDYGWIKDDSLGYYDEFNSNIGLEVNLKKGSPMTITGIDKIKIVKMKVVLYMLGSILMEWWEGIPGTSVSDLTVHRDYPDNPTGMEYLDIFESQK